VKFGMLVNTQDHPDGRQIPRLYGEVLREAKLAEDVGFDSVFVPEHHMMPDGYLPAPAVLLSAIAARTQRLRLGTAILQLPLWHPVHVAEQWAVLDNVSEGRAILGVGLGLVEPEFRLFGLDVKEAVPRFNEQLEIIRRAWTEEKLSFRGRFYELDEVSITPRVVQRPHPPIWIGAMSEAALKRAGRLGTGWISDPLHHIQVMKAWADVYRQSATEHGNLSEVVLLRDAWVAESAAEVERVWWPAIRPYHLFYMGLGFFESGRFNTEWEPWLRTLGEDEWTFDRIAPDRLIAGSPDEVVDEIQRYQETVGCDHLVLSLRHPIGPDHDQVMECIRRFGEEVLPRIR
jgi:probable F420-dependent oxidoreductase